MAGFGVAHPYPCLTAAAAMAFMNGLAAPLPTPANVGISSGTARILHEFGCRATPSHFRFDELMDALDQSDFLERAIWLIAKLNDGVFRVEQNFRVDSPMHEDRWPGYPDGWRPIWKGHLWRHIKASCPKLRVGRRLMRAGIVEVANMCDREGTCFLPWRLLVETCPRVLEHGAAAARLEYEELRAAFDAGRIGPVPWRAAWAAADAAECVRQCRGEGQEGEPDCFEPWVCERSLAAKEERVAEVTSGDGGCALAALVGLTGRPEWVTDDEEAPRADAMPERRGRR